jgi:DNA invertase Pin-like site-specific DNA recombinase
MSKAYGLVRVSTVQQGDDSKELQEVAIREYCRENGLDLVDVFPETVSAGKVPFEKRKSVLALLDVIEPGDHLIVWQLDRATRRFTDAAYLHILCKDHGLLLHIVAWGQGPIDLNDEQQEWKFIMEMQQSCMERTAQTRRMQMQMKLRRKMGLPLNASNPPLKRPVYRRDPTKRKGIPGKRKFVGYKWDFGELRDMEWACAEEDRGVPVFAILRALNEAGRTRSDGLPYGSHHTKRPNTRPLIARMKAYRELMESGELPVKK